MTRLMAQTMREIFTRRTVESLPGRSFPSAQGHRAHNRQEPYGEIYLLHVVLNFMQYYININGKQRRWPSRSSTCRLKNGECAITTADRGSMTNSMYAIVAEHLHRVYWTGWRLNRSRRQIVAVEDISFSVPAGTIFGLLGPNGAGKTTTIKMLSTLLIPSSGHARIGGHDVERDERTVRRQLGVVLGGDRGLYSKLSARDNLVYFGNLYGMRKDSLQRRVEEQLELVNLRDRAGERVEGYSRGMKQRLHLAKACRQWLAPHSTMPVSRAWRHSLCRLPALRSRCHSWGCGRLAGWSVVCGSAGNSICTSGSLGLVIAIASWFSSSLSSRRV